ncbi:MAG: acyl-CoA synthetase [Acidimicrobiales bacterium]|nr:MAG: acyl-CoA synthetase [Acidimicrobiales bacterium]
MLLHDVFEFHARNRPDLVFAVDGARTVTYGAALETARRVAGALTRSGIGPGDRFGFAGPNSVEHAVVYYAASMIGAVPVPLNPRLAPAEIAFVLADSGARALIADADVAAQCHDSIEPVVRVAVGTPPTGWVSWDDWIDGDPLADPAARSSPDTTLYQMYTSGTTGSPKGVILSHRAVLANCAQVTAGVATGVDVGDRWLIVAPLFHAAAVITAFNCVIGGGCLVLHRGFDPARVVEALHHDRIALTTLVPAMIQACLDVPGVDDHDYPDLQSIAYGGSAIAEPVLRRAMEVFGCDFYQGFGQTESSAGLTYLTEADHRRALDGHPELLASCGRPLPATEIHIVDNHGAVVPTGTIGEIVARGPQLMDGYWNRPDETAITLADGWLHTGDLGFTDHDGHLTVCDRRTDMIVSGGENVGSREVESVLLGHPAVADVAVIAVPHERWGEAVHAVVVPAAGHAVELDALVSHCAGSLARFKTPQSLELIDAIPRNAAGKALKSLLREPHWAGNERKVR